MRLVGHVNQLACRVILEIILCRKRRKIMNNVKKEYLQLGEIASLVGVTKMTILGWEKRHPDFPPRYKISRTVLFKRVDIDAWIESRLVGCNKEKSL